MKLTKQFYYSASGEKKINCFKVMISKDMAKEAGIDAEDNIKMYVKDKKIIIEKAK